MDTRERKEKVPMRGVVGLQVCTSTHWYQQIPTLGERSEQKNTSQDKYVRWKYIHSMVNAHTLLLHAQTCSMSCGGSRRPWVSRRRRRCNSTNEEIKSVHRECWRLTLLCCHSRWPRSCCSGYSEKLRSTLLQYPEPWVLLSAAEELALEGVTTRWLNSRSLWRSVGWVNALWLGKATSGSGPGKKRSV